MKKIIINIFLLVTLIFPLGVFNYTNASISTRDVVKINDIQLRNKGNIGRQKNSKIKELDTNGFFTTNLADGNRGIEQLLVAIARDAKNVVVMILSIVMLVLVYRLFFGENTEEQRTKFKSGIIWTTAGIVVMQTAYSVYNVVYDKGIYRDPGDFTGGDKSLGTEIVDKIISPFIDLLLFFASFIFIVMGIIAFYNMVTANGNEDKIKKSRLTIIQIIAGLIVIRLSEFVVKNTLSIDGKGGVSQEIHKNTEVIFNVIKWLNSFVAILVIIMIIYAGFLVFTSAGDSEKQKTAKNIFIYIAIGLLILVMSFAILTFFSKSTILG